MEFWTLVVAKKNLKGQGGIGVVVVSATTAKLIEFENELSARNKRKPTLTDYTTLDKNWTTRESEKYFQEQIISESGHELV